MGAIYKYNITILPLGVYPAEIVNQVNKIYEQICLLQHYNIENLRATLF